MPKEKEVDFKSGDRSLTSSLWCRALVGGTIGFLVGFAVERVVIDIFGHELRDSAYLAFLENLFGATLAELVLPILAASFGSTATVALTAKKILKAVAVLFVTGCGAAFLMLALQASPSIVIENSRPVVLDAHALLDVFFAVVLGSLLLATLFLLAMILIYKTSGADWLPDPIIAWTLAGPLYKSELEDDGPAEEEPFASFEGAAESLQADPGNFYGDDWTIQDDE